MKYPSYITINYILSETECHFSKTFGFRPITYRQVRQSLSPYCLGNTQVDVRVMGLFYLFIILFPECGVMTAHCSQSCLRPAIEYY